MWRAIQRLRWRSPPHTPGFFIYGFSTDRKSSILGGWAAPGCRDTFQKRWGAKPPTFSEGFPAARHDGDMDLAHRDIAPRHFPAARHDGDMDLGHRTAFNICFIAMQQKRRTQSLAHRGFVATTCKVIQIQHTCETFGSTKSEYHVNSFAACRRARTHEDTRASIKRQSSLSRLAAGPGLTKTLRSWFRTQAQKRGSELARYSAQSKSSGVTLSGLPTSV